MTSPPFVSSEPKKVFLIVEEEQWVDTFTWDDSSRAMVPLLHEGDLVEIQVVARPRDLPRVNRENRRKALAPIREEDAAYHVSGLVLQRKLLSAGEGGGPSRAMVAVLDCSMPLLCDFSLPEDQDTAESLQSSEWLSFDAVLYGEISYTTMPLTAPLAARIVSISAQDVTDDDFGNARPGYYVLGVEVRPGEGVRRRLSRLIQSRGSEE